MHIMVQVYIVGVNGIFSYVNGSISVKVDDVSSVSSVEEIVKKHISNGIYSRL